jgi:hypothetical protein
MLLRFLLFVLSYFHQISIKSITAAGSGKWISRRLEQKVFEPSGEDTTETRRLESEVTAWLADAYFALELADLTGLALVPFTTDLDINCYLTCMDVMAYRTMPEDFTVQQEAQLGGADVRLTIPLFLLPDHEHILPPIPTAQHENKLEQKSDKVDGKPQTIQARRHLGKAQKDETSIMMSVHASLPASFVSSPKDVRSGVIVQLF